MKRFLASLLIGFIVATNVYAVTLVAPVIINGKFVPPLTGTGDALVANPLSQFAATTSAQLAGVLSDETGTGAVCLASNSHMNSIYLDDQSLYMNTAGSVMFKAGAGSPEGVVPASVGSLWSRTDGGTDTTLYRKESGTGNTGWVATATGGGSGTVTTVSVVTANSLSGTVATATTTPAITLDIAAATTSTKGAMSATDKTKVDSLIAASGVYAAGDLTVNDGTNMVPLSPGTSGYVLTSNGAGVAPTYQAAGAGSGTVTNTGGDLTANAVMVGSGVNDSKTLASLGTSGQVLTSNGAGVPPSFQAPSIGEYITDQGTGNIDISADTYGYLEYRPFDVGGTWTPVIGNPPATGTIRRLTLVLGKTTSGVTTTLDWTNVNWIGTAGSTTLASNTRNAYDCFIKDNASAICRIIQEGY